MDFLDSDSHHDEDESHTGHDPLGAYGLGEGRLLDARDGILLLHGRLGCELWPRTLLLLLEVEAVPVVGQRGALTLPVFQECHRWKEKNKEKVRENMEILLFRERLA